LSNGAPAVLAVRGDRPTGVITKLDILEFLAHRSR
jgi:predicted transcriptional regulator